MAILNIKVSDLPESDAIPGGQYRLRIDEITGPEEDKNGDEFISVTYVVVEGEYINRKVNQGWLPLSGRSTLRKLLAAIGYTKEIFGNSDEIVGEELEAIVGVEKSDEYGDQNKIRSYIIPTKKPSMTKAGKGK